MKLHNHSCNNIYFYHTHYNDVPVNKCNDVKTPQIYKNSSNKLLLKLNGSVTIIVSNWFPCSKIAFPTNNRKSRNKNMLLCNILFDKTSFS